MRLFFGDILGDILGADVLRAAAGMAFPSEEFGRRWTEGRREAAKRAPTPRKAWRFS